MLRVPTSNYWPDTLPVFYSLYHCFKQLPTFCIRFLVLDMSESRSFNSSKILSINRVCICFFSFFPFLGFTWEKFSSSTLSSTLVYMIFFLIVNRTVPSNLSHLLRCNCLNIFQSNKSVLFHYLHQLIIIMFALYYIIYSFATHVFQLQ